MKFNVVDLSSSAVVDELDIDDRIVGIEVRPDIMARVVKWQLAKRRQGTHLVKTRATVKHTTRKPFRQKGTGRARQGMKSVGHMRGGGVTFGPVLRDHAHKLPKKVVNLGLRSAISSKAQEQSLVILKGINNDISKTAVVKGQLEKLGLGSVLIVADRDKSETFRKASANIIGVDVIPQKGLNVYDILKHNTLAFTVESIEDFKERLNV